MSTGAAKRSLSAACREKSRTQIREAAVLENLPLRCPERKNICEFRAGA